MESIFLDTFCVILRLEAGKHQLLHFCNWEGVNDEMDAKVDNQTLEHLTYEEKNYQLFLRGKELLACFSAHAAISQEQYDKSLHDLIEKIDEKGM